MFQNIRVNWLNFLLSIVLFVAGLFIMNWRDWHPDVFTGRSLFGLVLLALGAFVIGVLAVLYLEGDKRDRRGWIVIPAFVLGCAVTGGAIAFFMNTSVGWLDALLGFGVCVVVGGLIAGISLTKWEKRP